MPHAKSATRSEDTSLDDLQSRMGILSTASVANNSAVSGNV